MLLKEDGNAVTRFVFSVGILLIIGTICGCSEEKPKPVQVVGTVTTASGVPVSGVRLILAPDSGNVLSTAEFSLDQEGRFEGQALTGSYGFYFLPVAVELNESNGSPASKAEAKKLNDSHQSLNKLVPPAYRSPTVDGTKGTVKVTAGADIALVLSP